MAVTEAVDHLRELFQKELETPPETDETVASQVVTSCSNLSGWLNSSHPPRGFAKAGGGL